MKNNFIEIYKCEDGTTNVEVKFIKESVWLNLSQIAQLFNKDKSVISRHLRNIYQEGELDKTATVAKFATVQNENKRSIIEPSEMATVKRLLISILNRNQTIY